MTVRIRHDFLPSLRRSATALVLTALGALPAARGQDAPAAPAPAEEREVAVQGVIAVQTSGEEGTAIVVSAEGASGLAKPLTLSVAPGGMMMGGFSMGGGMGFAPSDELGVLGMEQFHEELGLVPDQKEKLATFRKELQQRRATAYADLRKQEPTKIGAVVRELEGKLQEETRARLTEILLPHQVQRLSQIRNQLQMRSRGANALAGGALADSLGLSEQQRAELAEKQREAEKQLREKVEEIRRQLLKDIVQDVLTAEQREKLTKLVGDEVKVKPVEFAPPAKPSAAPR
ncbi:MAG: hypothetical protein U0939_20720 [Pirellulales bacterium]